MADRHYTRQTPGSPHWTRPGYSAVFYAAGECWEALFVWWRPKWEDGRPGTERKDRLRVLECTHFRREGTGAPLASIMIRIAVEALDYDCVQQALHLDTAGPIDGLITGVGSVATSRRRGKAHEPGYCFKMAGWQRIDKTGAKADVWWYYPWSLDVAKHPS